MKQKCYRYYGGLLSAQENWLNRMAQKGYRLIRAEKLLYEFEACNPAQYQYRIEFIGQKSKTTAADYHAFLEDLGYRVFYKNINLNYAIGKVRYRPWAEKGGRLATNASTFNRELLIIEKENDGKAFELHTSFEDKANYYASLRRPWLCMALLFGVLGAIDGSLVFGAFAMIGLVPAILYQVQVMKVQQEEKTREW